MHSAVLFALAFSASASPTTTTTRGQSSDSLAIVAIDGCGQDTTSSSARLLRNALAAQPSVSVKSEDETLAKVGGPQLGSLQDAERLLASARLDFLSEAAMGDQAEKLLQQAMAILVSLPPSEPYRWQTIRDVASFQAMVNSLHHKDDAERALEKVLRVEPGFQVDKERYSPDLWRMTDRVRARLKAQATATLSVTSNPVGLPIAVDGRVVGKAPVVLEVPPGDYRVEGVFGDQRRMARLVHVEKVTSVEVEQAFDGAIQLRSGLCMATDGSRESRLAGLIKLASAVGVTQVVGIWQEEPARGEVYLTAAVVEAASGQELREAKVKVVGGEAPAEAIVKLARFVAKGESTPPVEPMVTRPRPVGVAGARLGVEVRAPGNSSRRTWAIGTGGVGLAALAGGVAFNLMAKSAYDDEKKAGEAGDLAAYQSAKSSLASRKTTAAVLYGVGVLGVGVSAYLFLTGKEAPSTTVGVMPVEGGAVASIAGRWP
jgi:hypothetical protein